jgi:hypothetical protein
MRARTPFRCARRSSAMRAIALLADIDVTIFLITPLRF